VIARICGRGVGDSARLSVIEPRTPSDVAHAERLTSALTFPNLSRCRAEERIMSDGEVEQSAAAKAPAGVS
jgi:hypothetical protein